MIDPAGLAQDLHAEGAALDRLVAPLEPRRWATPTPAPGWTIAHQIAHLAWTDRLALLAATRPADFAAEFARALEFDRYVDDGAEAGAEEEPAALLDRWRRGRHALLDVLTGIPQGTKLPWFGPPMSAPSMMTGRLMETWAHGLDVADALGIATEPTERLRHVAHIGVRARDHAFATNGLPAPPAPFRVELDAPPSPEGTARTWSWGPEDADQWVRGPALDFCLLVTRRRHRDDLALRAHGREADRWLDIAQAFAGPPGPGRAPTGTPPTASPGPGGRDDG
ncbi:TIGR03084 family metal-binding protein [Marinactinospora thermotolerans]|uniref:TIGR03084 family metal-binding protein n=1 Tax=Marinactinospora thermotolerans TaxID=531310 RepID=UPI003D941923